MEYLSICYVDLFSQTLQKFQGGSGWVHASYPTDQKSSAVHCPMLEVFAVHLSDKYHFTAVETPLPRSEIRFRGCSGTKIKSVPVGILFIFSLREWYFKVRSMTCFINFYIVFCLWIDLSDFYIRIVMETEVMSELRG